MKETKFWTFHIFAGILLLFVLGFHFLYTHIGQLFFNESDNISKELSQARDAKTSFLVFFIILLGLGLYHGLYGLKNILFEIFSSKAVQRVIVIFILIIGVALFFFGSYSSYIAHKNAAATKTEVSYAK
jgi:succinate dehydrogenase hydrophobic anchor subunit